MGLFFRTIGIARAEAKIELLERLMATLNLSSDGPRLNEQQLLSSA